MNAALPTRDALVLANLELARRYAARIVRVCGMVEYEDDAISEANVGLLEAAKRFDPSRGTSFSTYARWWVRRQVLLFIELNKYAVRQSRAKERMLLAIRASKIWTRLAGALGRPPTTEDFARELGVSEATMAEALTALRRRDKGIADHPEDDGVHVASDAMSPEDLASLHEENERISRALTKLDKRERKIIVERVLSDTPKKLSELGAELGLSRERIRQIEGEALQVLRVALRLKGGGR